MGVTRASQFYNLHLEFRTQNLEVSRRGFLLVGFAMLHPSYAYRQLQFQVLQGLAALYYISAGNYIVDSPFFTADTNDNKYNQEND